MAISNFIAQPATNSVHAAYRSVIIHVEATSTNGNALPPVVYCDIYFNDVFYKTISKTQYSSLGVSSSEWQFDLQDAAQEYLQKHLAAIAESQIVEATPLVTKVLCRMRTSDYDAAGFIAHDGTAPIQGTASSDPVSGTGTTSNTFYIVNATLQHTDNQELTAHLNSFKRRTWAANAYPLTHRPEGYAVAPGNSDSFPILYTGDTGFKSLQLNYRNCNQTTFAQSTISVSSAPACSASITTPIAQPMIGGGWHVYWLLNSGNPAKYFVSTPAISAGAPQETLTTSINLPWLPVGEHVITVRPLCFIEGDYYFGTARTVTITVAACVAVGFIGSTTLQPATAGVAYSQSIEFSGTAPLMVSNFSGPAWMNIAVDGNNVVITGTPQEGDIGEGIEVSFTVSNCTSDTYDFDGEVDVNESNPFGPFLVRNNAPNTSINLVTPAFYDIGVETFPVANGEEISGYIAAFTDAINVNITNAGAQAAYLRFIVNDSLVDCQTVAPSTTDNYSIPSDTYNNSDSITLILSQVPC